MKQAHLEHIAEWFRRFYAAHYALVTFKEQPLPDLKAIETYEEYLESWKLHKKARQHITIERLGPTHVISLQAGERGIFVCLKDATLMVTVDDEDGWYTAIGGLELPEDDEPAAEEAAA